MHLRTIMENAGLSPRHFVLLQNPYGSMSHKRTAFRQNAIGVSDTHSVSIIPSYCRHDNTKRARARAIRVCARSGLASAARQEKGFFVKIFFYVLFGNVKKFFLPLHCKYKFLKFLKYEY